MKKKSSWVHLSLLYFLHVNGTNLRNSLFFSHRWRPHISDSTGVTTRRNVKLTEYTIRKPQTPTLSRNNDNFQIPFLIFQKLYSSTTSDSQCLLESSHLPSCQMFLKTYIFADTRSFLPSPRPRLSSHWILPHLPGFLVSLFSTLDEIQVCSKTP